MLDMAFGEKRKQNKRSRRRQAGKSNRLLQRWGMIVTIPDWNRNKKERCLPFEPINGIVCPALANDDPRMDTRRWRRASLNEAREARKLLGERNGGRQAKVWRWLKKTKMTSRHSRKHWLFAEIQRELLTDPTNEETLLSEAHRLMDDEQMVSASAISRNRIIFLTSRGRTLVRNN